MTQDRISLTTAADTLAAIPALLGFTPENSVVVIALAGMRQIAVTLRIDAHDAEELAPQIASAVARQQVKNVPVDAVILTAIADPAHSGAALLAIDAIRSECARLDIDTIRTVHAYNLTTGTIFTDLDKCTDGTVPDPATSVVATARTVRDGQVIAAHRGDVAARFTPGDEIAATAGFVAAAAMGEDFLPITFGELGAVIGAREIPSTDLTSRVGLILATGHLEVRDAFMSMAAHGAVAAADTFIHIAAHLRGTARTQALTLAAMFLYSSGDGATANMAIDAAAAAATATGIALPSLTTLLITALEHGAPPAIIDEALAVATPQYVEQHIGQLHKRT